MVQNSSKLPQSKGYTNATLARDLHCSLRSILNWKAQIPHFERYVSTGPHNSKFINQTGFNLLEEKRNGTYREKQAQRERSDVLNIIKRSLVQIPANQHSEANRVISAINNKQNLLSNVQILKRENTKLKKQVNFYHYWYNRFLIKNQKMSRMLNSSWLYRIFHK